MAKLSRAVELLKKFKVLDNIKFVEDKDGTYIEKFWAIDICRAGGWPKKEFIELQILLYEIFEKILPLEDRAGRDTKSMIKYYKNKYRASSSGCPLEVHETENIKLCCLCGNKNIKIL